MSRHPLGGVFGWVRTVLEPRWQWLVLAQISQAAGMFVLFKLTANFLAVDSFGRFALALAVAGGVNVVLSGPLAGWASRHFQEVSEASSVRSYRRALMSAALGGTAGLAMVAAIIGVAAANQLHDLSISGRLFALGVTVGLFAGIADIAIASFNAAFRRRTAAVILLLSAWVRVAAVVGAYAVGVRTVEGLLAAMACLLAILGTVSYGLLFRFLRDEHRAEFRDYSRLPGLVYYAGPFVLWGIPGYLIMFGDKLILAHYTDAETVGVYAAMVVATISVGAFASAVVNRVLEPTVWRIAGSGEDLARLAHAHGLIRRVVVMLAAVSIPAILAYVAFPRSIVTVFSSRAYVGSARELWILASATALFLIGQQLTLHGLVEKRPAIYVPAKFLHAAMLVGLLFTLIPRYGLSGAIYALLLANAVQLGAVVLTNRLAGVS